MRPVLSSLLVTAALLTAAIAGAAPHRPLSTAEWRDDLRTLAAAMPEKHKALFHTMTEKEFTRAVDSLDADLPKLGPDAIEVRLAQLMALVQDGHTGLELHPFPPPEQPDRVALRFDRYPDGIFVRAAAPAQAAAVGGRLVAVGGVGWQEALRRVDSIESHDPGNEGECLAWSARCELACLRLLHGLGLADSPDSATFVIEKAGVRRAFTLRADAMLGTWFLNALPAGWVDARSARAPAPLSRQHEERPFWFTAVPEHHAVYFQFNLVHELGGDALAEFVPRLAAALAAPGVERLVIDLRNNTGGDNTLLRPLLVALIRAPQNHRGGMFVITGPTTFSAAQNFVNRLESYCDVIFVGAPTSQNVNFYGDAATITLPHSGLHAGVSALWWQDKDPRDARTATSPELAIAATFADYVAGRDPALELALATPTPESVDQLLERGLPASADTLLARYHAYADDPLHRYAADTERKINALGYRLLGAKRPADAIAVFEVNARAHPGSWNAFDSLGEACATAGDTARALEAYRRSVALNPANDGGRRAIDRLAGRR